VDNIVFRTFTLLLIICDMGIVLIEVAFKTATPEPSEITDNTTAEIVAEEEANLTLDYISSAILVYYVVEVVLRIFAKG
jgi:hypothetical protein